VLHFSEMVWGSYERAGRRYSAVVGSITERTRAMAPAGNPPRAAWVRTVDAIDLVVGDVALDPLNRRAHALQHAARLLRDRLQFLPRQFSGSDDLPFDDEFGHRTVPWSGVGHAGCRPCRQTAAGEAICIEADAPTQRSGFGRDQGQMSRARPVQKCDRRKI